MATPAVKQLYSAEMVQAVRDVLRRGATSFSAMASPSPHLPGRDATSARRRSPLQPHTAPATARSPTMGVDDPLFWQPSTPASRGEECFNVAAMRSRRCAVSALARTRREDGGLLVEISI